MIRQQLTPPLSVLVSLGITPELVAARTCDRLFLVEQVSRPTSAPKGSLIDNGL